MKEESYAGWEILVNLSCIRLNIIMKRKYGMRKKIRLICWRLGLCLISLSVFCNISCQVDNAESQFVQDEFQPLPPGSVHLTGFLEYDIQNSIEHWNKGVVPYEKLVDFFRYGREQFALGEMWGKAVRSGCMFYRYTQDSQLKDILDKTVHDLLTTERENGSISCVPPSQQPDGPGGDLWERNYVLLGLQDYYEYVNMDSTVLNSIIRQADCIISQIGESPKISITELGWSPNHIESSTLLEAFMRLYKWTGEKRFLEFARYIVEVGGGAKGYNLFQQAYDNVDPYKMGGVYPKAYEMMALFEGLIEYYRCTQNERWRQAFMNLYKNIQTKELTIVGNGGGDLPYHPAVRGEAWDNTAVEQTNPDITRMMETCVGVTWMKFCSQILRLTGDPSAVDCIETYVYNGLLGAMKPSGDGFSYVNLLNGVKVTNEGWGTVIDGLPVTCCNLNGPLGLAYIPYILAMQSSNGPVLNLYNAADINMVTPKKQELNIQIVTQYPLSKEVTIKVSPEKKENFEVKLRIPAWSKNTKVSVNGDFYKDVKEGEFLGIKRDWVKGDSIKLHLDMKCHLQDAPKGSNRKGDNYQALVYGPIVLARDERIDPQYDEPVQIVADSTGIVQLIEVEPSLDKTRMEWLVPTTKGYIRMTDYASVDCWNGTHVCTWLPKVLD